MAINIKKAIIHILNRDSEEPFYNDFELEITDDLFEFLEKHIIRSVRDEEARKAKFAEGMNIIRDVCRKMAEMDSEFMEGSREIARQLFKAMKTNSSISSTDLVICLYQEDEEEYVAILKMDYSTTFIHEVDVVDQKFLITIKKQEISLPGIHQKIQKCAFVKAVNDMSPFDLVVLDKQVGNKNKEEPVAQFFLQTFLGAELVLDSKASTKLFKKETENWIRNKSKEGEIAVEEIRESVNQTIRQEDEIDLEVFSDRVFEDRQYLKEDYIQCMKEKGLTEPKFEVDKDWVDKKLNKIRLKTDSNIEIILNYEDFTDKSKFEIKNNPDGSRSIIIRNIGSLLEN